MERCKNDLFRLTSELTPRQFTHVGYQKLFKMLTAPKANDYSIKYYDHGIIRPNYDHFLYDDKFANPQLTEKFLIRTPYVFTLILLDKKHDHIISEAVCDIQAYEFYYSKFNIFSLTIHFLTPKERDLHCSHDIMSLTKHTHIYTYYRFENNITHCIHHYDNRTIGINSLIPNTLQHSFLTSHILLKILTSKASTEIMISSHRSIFCTLTKTFNVGESRPLVVPHEFLQHIEVPILEFIHNTKYNHKPFNLIQNTPYEFEPGY